MKIIDLEIALMNYLDIRKNLVVPNVTNQTNLVAFETDILSLSKSGYASAFELKVSLADLKKDLDKKHIWMLNNDFGYGGKPAIMYFYSNLKYFYYVVPENLREKAIEQIPVFAGLLVAERISKYNKRIEISEARKANVIYKKRWSPDMQYQLARLGAMRILGYKEKLRDLK